MNGGAKNSVFYLSLYCLCFVIAPVEIQAGLLSRYSINYEDTKLCSPPLGGTCVEIRKCPFFSELLDRSPIPRPRSIVKIIREHHCGFENNNPKVCCSMATSTTTTSTTPRPTSVKKVQRLPEMFKGLKHKLSKHRNYHLLPKDTCGPISANSRITNGKGTNIEEFPWMVLVAYGSPDEEVEFRCGGTVINNRYVLTAAHCVHNSNITGVRLGEYDRSNSEEDCDSNYCTAPVQDFYVENVIPHQKYNPKTFDNDIALLRLTSEADFSYGNVQPICLPIEEMNDDLTGKFAIVSGWGLTEEGLKSSVLLKASIPVLPIESCKNLYKSFTTLTSQQICAGGYRGRDSCKGDSGGPMMYAGLIQGTPRFIQYGIVSFGPSECGTEEQPGIYTRVASYLPWILDNIKP
ncbi:CLIP domain-containing serine protease 2-like isoform X2 [Sitophilus oryzae]|uniref:CLIP domain-containing serine protease n=1 Tax=Sitophilus oryzae TaxID=7048 RepID=A0A6J2YPI5_SITOR|nr:CLIP domain-containing serine protease 2-like isoform X2 [Sitophilus oryzae]